MKNYNLSLWAWIVTLILVIPTYPASAHPGATNAEGCHTNRKTGEYHCHTHSKISKEAVVSSKPIDTAVSNTSVDIARTGDLLKLDYEGFTVWLDCSKRGAVKFRYNAQHDTGDFKRYQDFFLDPNVPAECQQKSTKGYGHGYDRGHQVPANHLDSSDVAIKQSNYMTNVLPQTSQMNRGAWLLTEETIECYRDIDELLVLGGVIWGNNPADDYFVASHGVRTPDAFWKSSYVDQDKMNALLRGSCRIALMPPRKTWIVTL